MFSDPDLQQFSNAILIQTPASNRVLKKIFTKYKNLAKAFLRTYGCYDQEIQKDSISAAWEKLITKLQLGKIGQDEALYKLINYTSRNEYRILAKGNYSTAAVNIDQDDDDFEPHVSRAADAEEEETSLTSNQIFLIIADNIDWGREEVSFSKKSQREQKRIKKEASIKLFNLALKNPSVAIELMQQAKRSRFAQLAVKYIDKFEFLWKNIVEPYIGKRTNSQKLVSTFKKLSETNPELGELLLHLKQSVGHDKLGVTSLLDYPMELVDEYKNRNRVETLVIKRMEGNADPHEIQELESLKNQDPRAAITEMLLNGAEDFCEDFLISENR